MSEIGWYKTNLRIIAGVQARTANIEKNPSFQILRRAVELVAQECNGTLTQEVEDYYGQKTVCDLAIVVPEFTRGVGIQVGRQTGDVNFIYDPSGGYAGVAQDIADEINQSYTAIALIRAMKSLGYEVEEEPAKYEQKEVKLVGVM